MSLEEHAEIGENPMFCGRHRENCHLELLKAAFIADVEFLLPLLYYPCSDYPVQIILREAEKLQIGRRCLNTLLLGREMLEGAITKFAARIPERSFEESRHGACTTGYDWVCLKEQRFTSPVWTNSPTRQT